MGLYKYVKEIWKNPKENLGEMWRQRLFHWRREPATIRVDKPTRIDRARQLGYKAKPGYAVVRARVARGGHTRDKMKAGRRSKNYHQNKQLTKSYQQIAEERVARKHPNCEILNSYHVIEDGKHKWYEVILVDKYHPAIAADSRINWIVDKKHTGRVFRGKTSTGRKARGLRGNKGRGTEKIRPSLRANNRKGN